MKTIFSLLILVSLSIAFSPTTAEAQSAGSYQIVTAGKSGQETGYGSVGEVQIGQNSEIIVTLTNYLSQSPMTYTGKLNGDVTKLKGPGNLSVKIRIAYSSAKVVFGSYTAFRGNRNVGGGVYSMTRR
jgi:hypothetical protein